MASATYELARIQPDAKMGYAIDLVFPAFDDLPEKTVRLGTRDFEVDGYEYRSKLSDIPQVRQQRGVAQDVADFQVNDVSGEFYADIQPYEDVIEDTSIVVKECLYTSLGLFESDTVLTGYVERITLSESDMKLSISAVSDMSRTGFLVGGRILSARYCAALFNINGLRDPEFDPCGWIEALGGNPTYCSHKRTGTDSCTEHGNLHRYFVVEALASAQVVYGSGSSGWGYGGGIYGGCFDPATLIWMGDGSYLPIYKVAKGNLVMAWDEANQKMVKGKVGAEPMTMLHDAHMSLDFGKGRIIGAAAEHPFRIGTDQYKCIGGIYPGEPVKRFDVTSGTWKDAVYLNDTLIQKRTRLVNLYIEQYSNYHVVTGDMLLNVSNNKPFIE